ncbi:hypothetical protein NFI96_002379 [Prochilodus magdalenae]|nr:hypothetical protein NFI96_002379 [Prochilodus magdalenae]
MAGTMISFFPYFFISLFSPFHATPKAILQRRHIVIKMPKIKTLNELAHLEVTRFGRPYPRHGLKLLYWFAQDCVSFSQYIMLSECDPESGDFGFHLFENRYDRNGVKLLPDVDIPYYVVGNLNSPGADELPSYVCEDYTGHLDNSNMDRVIVSLDNEMFDRVYVTEHDDRSNYNPDATYRISKGLLKAIRNLTLEGFLMQTGYRGRSDYIFQGVVINLNPNVVTPAVRPPRNWDYRIEIPEPEPVTDSNDWVTTGYSSGTERSTCCPCTILDCVVWREGPSTSITETKTHLFL